MTTLNLFDKATAGEVRKTKDGYLVGHAKVARTGIQTYLAGELGLTDRDPSSPVRVYRSEGEVFSSDSLASYAYRPMTVDHPLVMVTADNWIKYSRGQTGPDIVRDGEYVSVPMILMDQSAISEWEAGKRELSMGYTAEIVMQDGVTPEGEPYDALQQNLRMNHLALVSRARGGSKLKLGDDSSEEIPMSDKLKTILVDGLSVETTDAGEQAIKKLQGQLLDAQSLVTKAQTDAQALTATKDAELAKKDAEIDTLKGKVLSDADLDKIVTARADLIATAKMIADVDYTGMSQAQIQKTAVTKRLGDSAVNGKSDDYVAARFEILAEDAQKDPIRRTISNQSSNVTVLDNGYAESVRMLQEGPNYKSTGGAQ